jgi:hypothetical protein
MNYDTEEPYVPRKKIAEITHEMHEKYEIRGTLVSRSRWWVYLPKDARFRKRWQD